AAQDGDRRRSARRATLSTPLQELLAQAVVIIPHALDQSFPHRLRRQLVRWLVLSAAHLRQPGHGAGRQPCRARAPADDGAQALPLLEPADDSGRRPGPVAVACLLARRRRMAARQAVPRRAGGRLPPCLPFAAAQVRAVRQPAQRALVPRVQRSDGAAVRRHRRAGHRQAFLTRRTMAGHRSSAGPLAAMYTALIVYASLYPFTGW